MQKNKQYKFYELLNKENLNKNFKFTYDNDTYECKVREIINEENKAHYDIELVDARDLGTHFYLSQIIDLVFEEI